MGVEHAPLGACDILREEEHMVITKAGQRSAAPGQPGRNLPAVRGGGTPTTILCTAVGSLPRTSSGRMVSWRPVKSNLLRCDPVLPL